MLDFSTSWGRRVEERLLREKIIWLTTVSSKGTPQPVPIWFHWDGETILVFSERDKPKLRNVARNPGVSFNFNTDRNGGDVVVVLGEAAMSKGWPRAQRVEAFLEKYRDGIRSLGMTEEGFLAEYCVPIVVTPKSMRGF